MGVPRVLIIFMRIAMAVQILLGIGFWAGYWTGLVNLHMLVGVLFVLALWAIAGIAMAQRRGGGLAAFALLWGIVIVGVGMTQRQILLGDLHWIVRVLHLVIGIAAMPVGERLTGPRRAAAAVPA